MTEYNKLNSIQYNEAYILQQLPLDLRQPLRIGAWFDLRLSSWRSHFLLIFPWKAVELSIRLENAKHR